MNEFHRLREVTPNAFTAGIFTALDSLSVPWHDSVDSTLLNMEYYGNVSGLKLVSPLVFGMLENGELSAADIAQLANVAVAINGRNWAKQFATMEAEYNPIQNYDMLEQLSNDVTTDEYGHRVTRTDNLSHTKTGTDTRTDNLADNRTVNLGHTKTGTDTRTDNLTDARTANLTHGKTGTDTRTDNLTDARTANLTHGKTGTDTWTDNLSDARTVNLEHEKTGTDTRTDNLSDARTVNLEHEKTGTDTRTDNLTDTRTANLTHAKTGTETKAPAVTITNEATVYGFNSSTAVPANGNQQVSSGQETTTFNTQETDTGTDTTTHTGTSAQGYNTTETDTGTDTTTHTGTSAQGYNTTETDTGYREMQREVKAELKKKGYKVNLKDVPKMIDAYHKLTQEDGSVLTRGERYKYLRELGESIVIKSDDKTKTAMKDEAEATGQALLDLLADKLGDLDEGGEEFESDDGSVAGFFRELE